MKTLKKIKRKNYDNLTLFLYGLNFGNTQYLSSIVNNNFIFTGP